MNHPSANNNVLKPIEKAKELLFLKLLKSVWIIVTVYTLLFYFLGATVAYGALLIGTIALSPLTWLLEIKKFKTSARLLFIFSCHFYLYTTSLAFSHQISSEYYYLPALILPLLIFDSSQRTEAWLCVLLTFLTWIVTVWFGFSFFPKEWLAYDAPFLILKNINFIGAFILSLVFISIFLRTNFQLKDLLVSRAEMEATNLKNSAAILNRSILLLEESQSIAKCGGWELNVLTGELYWTAETYRIHDTSPEEFNPTVDAGVGYFLPASKFTITSALEAAMSRGEGYDLILETYTTKGRKIDVRTTCIVTMENGKAIKLAGIFQDITEKKLAETNLLHERAKAIHNSKLASLGEMSAGIAHEINNPLAIISGNTSLLKEFKDNADKFNAKILSIEKATQRIEKIVNGLRKFSRSTEDISVHSNQSLKNICEEVLVLTEGKAKRDSTLISLSGNDNLNIFCDAVEIEQVIINLINNGIDAVKNLTEKWVKLSLFKDENNIVLQVMDSGPCISESLELKIFEPFFTTKLVGEGTGLGLAVSKGILDNHDATIKINRSFPNTCFEIRFPLIKENLNVV